MTSRPHPRADAPFDLGRLFGLWLPLAFTFLLMSGSSPIVTRGIAVLPHATEGLAAFFDAFRVAIALHAPSFVVRDIAIRSVRDRRTYRRVFAFSLVVAVVCSAAEIVVGATVVGDRLLTSVVRTPPELIPMTKRAILPFAALPVLITIRGIHQGVHIRGETTRWVGIGTALRLGAIAIFALVLAPHLGIEAALMGSLCFVLALVVESVVNVASALRQSPVLRVRDDGVEDGGMRGLAAFALPLMLANVGGVLFQPLVSRVAGDAGDPATSKAALQVLISWVWFFTSSLFAMQAMTIAHATDRQRLGTLVRFGAIVAAGFGTFLALAAVVHPVRQFILADVFGLGAEEWEVARFVLTTLPLAIGFPVLVLVRSILRGLIVRSGQTGWIVLTTAAGLAALLLADRLGIGAGRTNGAVPAVEAWLIALLVEAGLAGLALLRIGLRRAYEDGRARPAAVEPARDPLLGGPPGRR